LHGKALRLEVPVTVVEATSGLAQYPLGMVGDWLFINEVTRQPHIYEQDNWVRVAKKLSENYKRKKRCLRA
jgi:hypothetical protein